MEGKEQENWRSRREGGEEKESRKAGGAEKDLVEENKGNKQSRGRKVNTKEQKVKGSTLYKDSTGFEIKGEIK